MIERNSSETVLIWYSLFGYLTAQVSGLMEENAALKEKLARYESKERNNSKNTSQPPSKDQKPAFTEKDTDVKQKATKPVQAYNGREKTGRKPGGQQGHEGKTLTKEDVQKLINEGEVCHEIVNHGVLSSKDDYVVRYELTLECVPKVVEHRFSRFCVIPTEYNSGVVYGSNVKDLATLLHAAHHVSLDRVSSILSHITNGLVAPSKGTIYRFLEEFAHKSLPEYISILGKSINAPIIYTDGTHITVNGKRGNVRNVSTQNTVFYEFLPTKSKASLSETLVLPFHKGTEVHDHETTIYNFGTEHGECNAHTLRYLRKTLEDTGHMWPNLFMSLLTGWQGIKETAISQGRKVLSIAAYTVMKEEYDTILALGWAENKQLDGLIGMHHAWKQEAALLNRLKNYGKNILLYLYDFDVDFTNNRSERDLRFIKGHLKMSGGFRSKRGVKLFCRFQTVYQTLKKIGQDTTDCIKKIFARDAEKIDGFSACLPCLA